MKAIILAAGYATRLYPLTIDKPKALLPICEKPILNYIVEEIETIAEIDELVIVSNDKFYGNFVNWQEGYESRLKITVLNDNTTDDTNKLGAIGDIWFVIEKTSIDEDVLIMAGDNIFTFKLLDYYKEYKEKNADMILTKQISSIEDLRRMANVETDETGRVINLVEKPQNPKSNIAAYASYIYKKETIPLIKQYLDEGNNPDAPGFFPAWLHKIKPVYTYTFEGDCYDIGTPEAYAQVNEIFKKL